MKKLVTKKNFRPGAKITYTSRDGKVHTGTTVELADVGYKIAFTCCGMRGKTPMYHAFDDIIYYDVPSMVDVLVHGAEGDASEILKSAL